MMSGRTVVVFDTFDTHRSLVLRQLAAAHASMELRVRILAIRDQRIPGWFVTQRVSAFLAVVVVPHHVLIFV